MRRMQLLCFAMALLALPSLAVAGSTAVVPDSFSPLSVNKTINVGDSFDIMKTFSIGARTADTPVDIYFLFDTSGSFQSRYNDPSWVNTVAPGLISQAAASLGGRFNDVQFAVGRYEDFNSNPWGTPPGDSPYTLVQGFTGNTATALTALTTGIAGTGTGGDTSESNLHSLGNAAGEASWRADSVKIVVWLGDAPGHVPGEAGLDGFTPVFYPGTFTTDGVIGAMTANDMLVEAFNFAAAGSGLDAEVRDYLNVKLDELQGTKISGASGGDLWNISGANTTAQLADFYTKYQSALDEAFALYVLGLDTSDLPAGLSLSIVPPGTTSGDRTLITGMTETYQWKLTFTGNNPGVYTFPIRGMIDGKILGIELDHITVLKDGTQPPPEIPEPTTFALLGLGLLGIGIAARRRKK